MSNTSIQDERVKAYAEQAKKVLSIQDASNIVAVLGAWHQTSLFLLRFHAGNGPSMRTDPLMIMYMSKIASMMEVATSPLGGVTWGAGEDAFGAAYKLCQDYAKMLDGAP